MNTAILQAQGLVKRFHEAAAVDVTVLDGVSLTVAALDDAGFTIAMIPYTRDAVIMGRQAVGTPVNLEVDIIAKYVERLTRAHRREEV